MGFTQPSTLLSLLVASAAALDPSQQSALLPTEAPTVTDNWECAISTYSTYFDLPKPTGTLLSALESYGDKLYEACTKSMCLYPDATSWCGFATAAPTAVLPAYTSYASSASVWWAEHSSAAVELAQECPEYWWDALLENPSNSGWLDLTIAHAECLAGLPASGSSRKVEGASVTSSTSSASETASAKPSSAASAPSSVATSAATKFSSDGKELLLSTFINVVGLVLLL